MNKILVAALLLVSTIAMGQKANYVILQDAKSGLKVFKGQYAFKDLLTEPTFTWMQKGIATYKPDEGALKTLRENLGKRHIIVFLGTWCEDSQNLIPKLYKVLNLAQYPMANLDMYGVDREKTTGSGIEQKYKITLVPTIIILDGQKELGRITESVDKSIEADMVKIIMGK